MYKKSSTFKVLDFFLELATPVLAGIPVFHCLNCDFGDLFTQMSNTLKMLDIYSTLYLHKLPNTIPNPHKIHSRSQTRNIYSYSLPARGEGWGGVYGGHDLSEYIIYPHIAL